MPMHLPKFVSIVFRACLWSQVFLNGRLGFNSFFFSHGLKNKRAEKRAYGFSRRFDPALV